MQSNICIKLPALHRGPHTLKQLSLGLDQGNPMMLMAQQSTAIERQAQLT